MCKVLETDGNGPDMRYIPGVNYVYDKEVQLQIWDDNFVLRCWEDGRGWMPFPIRANVLVDAGCVFQVAPIERPPINLTELKASTVPQAR